MYKWPALLTRRREKSVSRSRTLFSRSHSLSSSSSGVMTIDAGANSVPETIAIIEATVDDNIDTGDIFSDDSENHDDVGGTNAAAVGAGNVFVVIPPVRPVMNKSVLWDLEAPVMFSFLRKYVEKNNERGKTVSTDVNQFWLLMEGISTASMAFLSNETALSILRLRLIFYQSRKNEYHQLMEEVEGAAWHFRDSMLHLDFDWDTKRLDRAVVNYLLRMRYLNTAGNFAATRHIQDIFHFEPYLEAETIVRALRNKNLKPAKAWCNKHAPEGKLEFHLLCQEYIEYVRANQKRIAISFAWKFTVELWEFKKELLKVLAAVAFGCNTRVLRYKKLFDEERWEFLVNLFEQQFNLVHWYTKDASSLCILLESGITALKVPFCYDDGDCKKDDPLECEYFRTFASSLPLARPFSPNLLCHVTKKPLTKEHPPLMLPNGYAYSEEAILQMQNGDEITCPRTGSVFKMDDVKQLKFDTKW